VDAPVLTGFTALSTDVDSSQPGAQLGYSYTGTDDYSGANSVWVSLRTDDYAGWTYLQADVGYPDTSLKGKVAVDALGLLPGTGPWNMSTSPTPRAIPGTTRRMICVPWAVRSTCRWWAAVAMDSHPVWLRARS
jgi:hypothetical protein